MPYPFPFPDIIDSTALVTWRSCNQKGALAHIALLEPRGDNVHLKFGGALAHGLERARKAYYLEGTPAREAENMALNAASDFWGDFPAPTEGAKNWGTLLLAIDGYFKQWPLDTDPIKPLGGKSGIEFSFSIAIPEVRRPDNGEPVCYGGRFDLLGEWDGMLCLLDEKTTGKGFGGTWSQGWTLRNQFMMYVWACQQYGYRIDKVFIRGISVQKTKIDFAPAIATFGPHLIERAYKQVVIDLQTMVNQWKANYFSYNFGDTCTAFGGCPYYDVCAAQFPEEWYSMFGRRTWSPLKQDPTEESNTP